MFNVDEDELLALNRHHYPAISCNSVLLHGSPLELPRSSGAGVRTRVLRGMKALKARSTREVSDEKWLDVEIYAPENMCYTRLQAVLLYRSVSFLSSLCGRA